MKSLVFSSCLLVLLPTASAYADTPPVTPGMIQASQAAASPAPTGPVAIVGDQVGLVPAKIPSNATIVHVQSQKQNQVQNPTSKNGNASTRSKNTPSQKIDATKNQSSSVKQKVGLPARK